MKLFRMLAAVSGLLAALVVSAVVFATDVAVVDYSTDIAAAVVGLVAGVAASIAAVFVVAGLIRVTFKGARLALKALGMIR